MRKGKNSTKKSSFPSEDKGNFLFYLAVGIFVLIIGLFSLKDSFRLSLFGDDWLAFWRYTYHLGPNSIKQFNHISYFLTVYGPQDVFMGLLEKVLGFHSFPYYLISFILRLCAALSLYPIVYFFTKNKWSAFLASLIFSASFVGIETTNWVFNMPSYLGITFFNLFLYFYIKSREDTHPKKFILSGLFFYLAFITVPIRMTGLPLILIITEILLVFPQFTRDNLKKSLIRIGIIFLVFLGVKFGGQSLGLSSDHMNRVQNGLSLIGDNLSQGNFSILLHPFIILGGLIVPDLAWGSLFNFTPGASLFYSLIAPIFIGYIGILLLFYKTLSDSRIAKQFLAINFFGGMLWCLFIRFTYKQILIFNDPFKVTQSVIGGLLLLFALSLSFLFIKKYVGKLMFLSIVIIVLSFSLPWLFEPLGYFSTSHRYLILTSAGLALFLGSVFSLFSTRLTRTIGVGILFFILFLHISSNQMFFKQRAEVRGDLTSEKIWNTLYSELPDITKSKTPLVFYFEGDTTNSDTINDVITFGFPPHMGLLYGVYYEDQKIPIPTQSYIELKDMVTTGNAMFAYGRPKKPLPIDHIYAFKLKNRDTLTNITKEIREKLLKETKVGKETIIE